MTRFITLFFCAVFMAGLTVTKVSATPGPATIQGTSSDGKNESGILKTAKSDFESRRKVSGTLEAFRIFDTPLTGSERSAMEFLYAYMPLPDITDYPSSFYLKNVDCSLLAKEEMPWGKIVPEREFYHFVLPVRVNNENLDESRIVFYEELKERVKGLSMYDAALEVNHWCHEKVTYRPTDSRTSSPLASIRTAYGRCGEESTFTVAAMRSVGIPARQIYTPRWAHTDDNHAWVEVWIDGKWHFLGACEPEPVLDLGWFNAPASRGMLMHTNVFGKYEGPEDIVATSACYTEINVTANYAPVSTLAVRTVDRKGRPVSAEVEFKLYNYGELYTVLRKQSDSSGMTHITAGHGDMVIWASKDGMSGVEKCRIGSMDTLTVKINRKEGFTGTMEFDIVPPPQRNTVPQLSDEQVAGNKMRLAYEDSVRNAYTETFMTAPQAREFAARERIDPERAEKVLVESRGNWQAISGFLHCASDKEKALRLLEVISEKDLHDTPMNVLKDHLDYTPDNVERSQLYDRYILNPRIANELLTPYRSVLSDALGADAEKYRLNPELWAKWCKENISIDNIWNPKNFRMHPVSVWKTRTTDKVSLEIFFVAGARSMGIAARIDEVTGKVQYADRDGNWKDVEMSPMSENEKEGNAPVGILSAEYVRSGRLDNPKYYSHFTLSRVEDGKMQLLNYPEDESWERLLKKGTQIDAGHYLMTSGTRMADGSVLARLSFFDVKKGKRTKTELVMREDKENIQVIGSFNSEDIYHDLSLGQDKSLLSTTGRGYYILGLVEPAHEPTNHALRDIAAYKEELEKWGGCIVLLFEDMDAAKRFNSNDFPALPNTVVYGTDIDGAIASEIREALNLPENGKPVFIIADTFNRVVFVSQGYTIGLGEQLAKVLSRIDSHAE